MRFHVRDEISLHAVETRAPAHCVDGLEAGGGMSHGRGLSGMPICGHDSRAAANASCMTSSATSRSPRRRTSVARTLPDSDR